jgi:hypothetical protein
VLELEKDGIYFSKDLSKSILYSIAAPGRRNTSRCWRSTSTNSALSVCATFGRNGWFQTVLSDLPHFTFLGCAKRAAVAWLEMR